MKRILFLAPHPPGLSASQRFRFEQYLELLRKEGFDYDYYGFIDPETWHIFFNPGKIFRKVSGIMRGYFRRLSLMGRLSKYDYVFIHREASPVGPSFFEWYISRVARKKMFYDFDDAIWISVASESNPYARWIKNTGKVKNICRFATTVLVGNQFLAEFAMKYNSSVRLMPTVVDTINIHNKVKLHQSVRLRVGWTGTFTNFSYLESLVPVMQKLKQRVDFRLLIIADKDPGFENISYEFLPWNKETEISDLLQFDVGLMPLPDTALAKGKCAFKAIQYMALGIPAVVSAVGANIEVVDTGLNGFVCSTAEEWEQALFKLLTDEFLRARMGYKAREKIVNHYSVTATEKEFLALFD